MAGGVGISRRGVTAALVAVPALAAGAAPPRRIVSLTPCLDAILVHVADRSQIAALSHWSAEPGSSSIGELGRTFPTTRGSAEEVLALRPDLVLAARFWAPATRQALVRARVPMATFGVPASVEENLVQVREMAAAVGRPDRGEALVRRIEAAIAAAAPPPGAPRLSALLYQSGGFAAAGGTLIDDLLHRAGFDNAATRYGLTHSGNVPLERLVADPPDVLLAGELAPGKPTWADRVLAHPALRRLPRRVTKAVFPQTLTYCGGPVLIDAAARLAQIRRQALEARA